VRYVTIEALVFWTYGRQRADRYLRGAADFYEYALEVRGVIERRPRVHPDAFEVHAAVLQLLQEGDGELARTILRFAPGGEAPTRCEAVPRPYPTEPLSRHEEHGWALIDGKRVDYLIKTAEIVAVPASRRRGGGLAPVAVRYCPLTWSPAPELIERTNREVMLWQWAMAALHDALRGTRFTEHCVTGLA
jgi:hypothetical protein